MIKEQYNQLPRPTFRWMKVNHLELPKVEAQEAPQPFQPLERHEGPVAVCFYNGDGAFPLKAFTGANDTSLAEVREKQNTGCRIDAPAGSKSSVWLTYELSEQMPQIIGQLGIKAEAGSQLDVYINFEGGAAAGSVNFLTYVEAAANAHVKISKIQLHDETVRHIEHRYAHAAQNGTVEYVNAEMGSKETVLYYQTDLMEEKGKFKSQAMYLGNDHQVFDFSYWVPQQGVKTETDIVTTGSLMEQSRKYFRGTIDFLRGGKQAVGSESDTCLLLSPGAHSISIPLLLCKEDDVVGNHASSAGQIDKDKLFYLMSRGFSEAGAQLIIVESNIRPVIDNLGDTEQENKVLQAVREKMQSCHKKGDCHDKCTKRFPHID